MGVVGTRVPRLDGLAKSSGRARYVDDLVFPGMLHARTIRSAIPHGRIRSIRPRFDPSGAGFTMVGAEDIPGRNVVTLIEDDQPCLASETVHHMAEPILLLAHEDPDTLREARVDIEYESLDPVLDYTASERILNTLAIDKGDVEAGLAEADRIVEGEYRTGHQEHVYIEMNGMVAIPEEGGVTIHGSLQCPHYVVRAVAVILGLPEERVRVIQAETGGGFGGKEEYPNMIGAHAALLAMKSGRPVKLVYDRVEDMVATTKRHPALVRHRTGVMNDGRLTASHIEIVIDGGAYLTLSPVVLSRGAIHAGGPYRCEHVRMRGKVMHTHTPPNGAFRGFGAPQTQFAGEVHMERIAEVLGMDPVDLRRRNALRPGDVTATGQTLGEDCSALQCLDEAVRRSDFHGKRERYRGTGRGIGLSLFFHGSGFTGGGEVKLASRTTLELTERGVRIRVGSAEIGQGTRTIHAQIVADTLGLPIEAVETALPDTSLVPDSGPTVASRTCMVVGGILQRCAREMRERLGELTPAQYLERHGPLSVTKEYRGPDGIHWDDDSYRGDAYAAFGWACDVAEVELDPVTYEVRPLAITAVQEIGRAIHPVLVAGQIEGGTAQGLGYALLERVVMENGVMKNAQLTNYLIPTTLDTPPMEVVILENPTPHGPYGAKGVGEMPIDGVAPAVVNAIRHLGIDLREIPAVPERIMELAEPESAA